MSELPPDSTNDPAHDAAKPETEAAAAPDPALMATTTTLARRWTTRVWIIGAICAGMFIWGLIDSMIVYPARGLEAAEFMEYQYLRAVEKAGKMAEASVADPAAELTRLEDRKTQNILAGEIEPAKLAWLEALKNAAGLSAKNTTIDNPRQQIATLEQKWGGASAKPPSPLESYDLPVQYLITLVGFLFLVGRLVTALPIIMRKRYTWDPATHTLTLPTGQTLVPADIVEYDKRKWDKFIVVLGIRDGHPTLSGQKLKIDTYVVNELEPWILEMERLGPTNTAATAAA